jgi:hypothetical protein
MKKLIIKDREILVDEISQIYPAAMVKTGEGSEVTQISLEWADTHKDHPEVEIVNYALFIHTKDKETLEYYFNSREELNSFMENLANQIE